MDFKGSNNRRCGGSGTAAARIEVAVGADGALGRVAIVQSSYSPLTVAAGVADRSSMLVYDAPEQHLRDLEAVEASLGTDPEAGYVPTAELCVTPLFDRLILRSNPGESGEDNDVARRTWLQTKAFLKRLSTLTANCIDAYTLTEIQRTGAHELQHEYRDWRACVA